MKTTFSVWYMRPEFFREGISGAKPDPANLAKTHVFVKDIELTNGDLTDLESIYVQMQGEVWSPNGEARELIESKGLQHTSMSVGDVVVVDGKTFVAASLGFDPVMAYTKEQEAQARLLWLEYCASGKKPADIPSNPDVVYANDWAGWCDWIGGFPDLDDPGHEPNESGFSIHPVKRK